MDGYEQFCQSWNNRGNIHWNKLYYISRNEFMLFLLLTEKVQTTTGLKNITSVPKYCSSLNTCM